MNNDCYDGGSVEEEGLEGNIHGIQVPVVPPIVVDIRSDDPKNISILFIYSILN
jgi:hypothetical protein